MTSGAATVLPRVSRLFRSCSDGRNVHARTAGPDGDAPVLLALHESPRSSVSLKPLMQQVGGCLRVIAPDTAGYGLSDPLAKPASGLSDYVAPLIDLIDSLGLAKIVLYGTHTGATIACEFALEHPDRVSHLLLDGVPLFTAEEKALFAEGYFPDYAPQWDGSHVMALWSRVLDQARWFPWHERKAGHCVSQADPDVAQLDATVAGQLLAGADYHQAYGLAIAYDTLPSLSAISCPVTVFARHSDLLHPHLDRLPASISGISINDDSAEWGALIADIAVNSGASLSGQPDGNSPTRRMLRTSAGEVHAYRRSAEGSGRNASLPPFLSGRADGLQSGWIIDPPGFGLSGGYPESGLTPDDIIAAIAQAARQLDAIAPEPAPLSAAASRLLEQAQIPAPALDGRHLLTCWFAVRNALHLPGMMEPPPLERVEKLFRSLFLAPHHREAMQAIQLHASAEYV